MLVVFIRVLIIYITVLVFLRLMGKRQIGEMQPYEVVITLIIADLATLPMSDTNIPLLHGILPLATELTRRDTGNTVYILDEPTTGLHSYDVKKLVDILQRLVGKGNTVVVIGPNGLEYQAFKSLNITIDDIIEMLRQNGYYSFDQIAYAIIETNGKISVIPKSACAPATARDVNVKNEEPVMPNIIISDGKMMKNQMQQANVDVKMLSQMLKHLNINSVKDVIIFSVDENGKVYYQTKQTQASIVENIFKEIK